MPLGSPSALGGFTGLSLALLSVAACRSAAPTRSDAGSEVLGGRLALRHFDQLAWTGLTEASVPLPDTIAAEVTGDVRFRFRDRERFRNEVLAVSRRLGVAEDAIAALSPREAVIHAIDVVTSRLEFALVDTAEFREKYPARLFPEIDLYFHEAEGDCDKYRDLVKAVFALFREMSPARLQNVYVVSQGFGGKDVPHAWNAVLISLPGSRLEVAHVDPTFYDGGGDLGATEENVSATTFRLSFLFRVGEYAAAREEITRIMPTTDPWTREALYAKKAAIELRLAENGEGDYAEVIATFNRAQVDGCDHPLSRHFDRLLSSAIRAYAALGRESAARRAFERLSRDYPRSVFRATLAHDRSLGSVLSLTETSG